MKNFDLRIWKSYRKYGISKDSKYCNFFDIPLKEKWWDRVDILFDGEGSDELNSHQVWFKYELKIHIVDLWLM